MVWLYAWRKIKKNKKGKLIPVKSAGYYHKFWSGR